MTPIITCYLVLSFPPKYCEISKISGKKTNFLRKTNPIRQSLNCPISLCTKALHKIHIFVESQFKANSKPIKPNQAQTYTGWAIWVKFYRQKTNLTASKAERRIINNTSIDLWQKSDIIVMSDPGGRVPAS